jgi:hypothetical protein
VGGARFSCAAVASPHKGEFVKVLGHYGVLSRACFFRACCDRRGVAALRLCWIISRSLRLAPQASGCRCFAARRQRASCLN